MNFCQNCSACYCVNVSGQRKSERIQRIIFTEKFSLSWSNKQRVSHSIITNNSACKTLQAHSEQLNTSTDKEDQEAELKSFVCFKGRSGYRGLPRFSLCLTNRIRICRSILRLAYPNVSCFKNSGSTCLAYLLILYL